MHVSMLMIIIIAKIPVEIIELNHSIKMMTKLSANTFNSFKNKIKVKDFSQVFTTLPKTLPLVLLNLSPKFYVIVYVNKCLNFY